MNKLYHKSEIWFSIILILIYVVGSIICDNFSTQIGTQKVFTLPFLFVLSLLLYIWINKNKLNQKYGLCRANQSIKNFLYYIPLFILITVNLWLGVQLNSTITETILYACSMLFVGFLEEIIFRGFLFKAIAKDGIKSAIIISSITFGFGHIINLLTNGMDNLIPNLCQVCYAIAIGFLFVIIFYRGGSLLPCIITHSIFNALSVFSNNTNLNESTHIIVCVAIILITVPYTLILLKTTKTKNNIIQKTELPNSTSNS